MLLEKKFDEKIDDGFIYYDNEEEKILKLAFTKISSSQPIYDKYEE